MNNIASMRTRLTTDNAAVGDDIITFTGPTRLTNKNEGSFTVSKCLQNKKKRSKFKMDELSDRIVADVIGELPKRI